MKAKILNVMDVYCLSNPLLCRGGSKLQFSYEIWSQITGGKNDCRKMAASSFCFHKEIGRFIS